MKKQIVVVILIVLLVFYTCSCDQNIESQENDCEKLYQEALFEINDLKIKVNSIESQNKELVNTVEASLINLIDTTEFEWFNTEAWDEICIIQYYPDYDSENTETTKFLIKDGNLLKMHISFIFPMILNFGQPIDPGEGGIYKYEFTKDMRSYIIDVYDPVHISYNGKYYYCPNGIYMDTFLDLGEAFLPNKDQTAFDPINDYLNFIYRSSICLGDKIYDAPVISKSRNQTVAKVLKTLTSIPKPDDIEAGSQENLIETLTYYSFGETLKMMIFRNYIHVIYREQNIWLARYEDGEIQPVESILSVYGAN